MRRGKSSSVLVQLAVWFLEFDQLRARLRQNYRGIPLEDLNIYQASDTYYGDGRAWAVGSNVSDEDKARILEFMDWLCSPEGLTMQHIGQEGFIYTVNDDGTYTLTDAGMNKICR